MLARHLANRFVLRPTRYPLHAEGMLRCRVSIESTGWVETTLFRLVQGEPVPAAIGSGGQLFEIRPPLGNARVHQPFETQEAVLTPEAVFCAKSPELLVVKFPGTAGRAERSTPFPAHFTKAATAEVWTWNPPGYGQSPGTATLSGIARAAGEFIQAIWQLRGSASTRLWVSGNSLGCASGIYASCVLRAQSKVEVDGLILRNPPPLISLVSSRDAWWNLWRGGRFVSRGVPVEMDAIIQVQNLVAPILFLESAEDRIVPPDFQAEIRRAHRGYQRTMTLIGADHATPLDESHRGELLGHLEWLWGFAPFGLR